MGMVSFIVERGIPTKIIRRDVHGGGNIVAVCAEQISP